MISPYLGYLDGARLSAKVADSVNNTIHHFYTKSGTDVPYSTFQDAAMKMIPDHLVHDIYNLYYTKSVDHEFAALDETNRGKWKLLQSVNDSSLKVITNNSQINSAIFTTEICNAIITAMFTSLDKEQRESIKQCMSSVKAKKEDNEDEDDEGKSGGEDSQSGDGDSQSQGSEEGTDEAGNESENDEEGSGESGESDTGDRGNNGKTESKGKQGNSEDESDSSDKTSDGASKDTGSVKEPKHNITKFEQLINQIDKQLQSHLDAAKAKAFKKISEIEQLGINIKDIEERGGGSAINMIGELEEIMEKAKQVNVKSKGLKSILEKIIDKSLSYFSKSYKSNELSIFDSDNIDEIDGIENFHPKLKRLHLEDVVTRENKYKGRINVYVDVSGSMSSNCCFDGQKMDTMLFAKSLILKLMEMNMVNVIIPFGSELKKPIDPPNIIDVLLLNAHCGTDIDEVVRDCERRMENGLVITDCQDRINYGSEYCFILGTPGARFSLIGNGAQEMRNNKQLWLFNTDGDDIREG